MLGMGLGMKARKMREMNTPNLRKKLVELKNEIAKFEAASGVSGGNAMIKLPTGKGGGVNWGLMRELKKDRARAIGILWERKEIRGLVR
jgi:ribosomal protein L29